MSDIYSVQGIIPGYTQPIRRRRIVGSFTNGAPFNEAPTVPANQAIIIIGLTMSAPTLTNRITINFTSQPSGTSIGVLNIGENVVGNLQNTIMVLMTEPGETFRISTASAAAWSVFGAYFIGFP